jgi:hypothetical protein
MAFRTQEQVDAFESWAKAQIDAMGRHAHTSGLVDAEAVGRMVWAVPHKVFLGKVWPKNERNASHWVIAGESLPTDHIEARLAASPRDAARHFALKWQMESTRLADLSGQDSTPGGEIRSEVDWARIGETLERQAELLYAFVERDDVWDAEKNAYDKLLPPGA